jgi:hypothetical protein
MQHAEVIPIPDATLVNRNTFIDDDRMNIVELHARLADLIDAGYGDTPVHVALLTEAELHDRPIQALFRMDWRADHVHLVDEPDDPVPFVLINAVLDRDYTLTAD